MIKDAKYLRAWEEERLRQSPADYRRNLRIFEELMELARKLKAWPPKDPMEGIEVDIEIAKIINTV